MKCKNLLLRTKKGIKYLYCKTKKTQISFNDFANCNLKEYKCTIKPKSLCKKNPKIAKLERNRKSVFTNNLTKCILCNNPKEELHEIFSGRNRQNSMKYNFVLPLCHKCHSINQENSQFNEFWHKKAQLYYEQHLGSRNEFITIFGRNYL